MTKYNDKTLEPISLTLAPGEKELVLVPQDECIVHMNDLRRRAWLKGDQQPLKKKGNGRGIHICSWICETTGHLKLSEEQVNTQALLPEDQHLKVTDSTKIIYPGKNYDEWWDLPQLMEQMKHAINIFEHLHPDKVAIWLFNCSSAHEALAKDTLNVNNMGVRSGGKQSHLRDTIIPLNNPPPKPGRPDTRGQTQCMVYPDDHPDEKLRGQPKGMQVVLQKWELVWDQLTDRCKGKVPVWKCKDCMKSQVKKGAERRVAEAEAMGQEDTVAEEDIARSQEPEPIKSKNDWCCMH